MFREPGVEPNPNSVDLRPSRTKQFKSLFVATKLYAFGSEYPIGVFFEAVEFSFGKQLIGRDLALGYNGQTQTTRSITRRDACASPSPGWSFRCCGHKAIVALLLIPRKPIVFL